MLWEKARGAILNDTFEFRYGLNLKVVLMDLFGRESRRSNRFCIGAFMFHCPREDTWHVYFECKLMDCSSGHSYRLWYVLDNVPPSVVLIRYFLIKCYCTV